VDNELETQEITKEFLGKWMERRETEGAFNQGKRISCVKQLLLYMATCGICVYIPHDFCHFKKALPHIFDSMEIICFFHELDCYPTRHNRADEVRLASEYRMIFRLYCCCGLRNSEAAGIASENVNLEDGILTILNSKGSKDRLVYLPDDLLTSCQKYYKYLCDTLGVSPKWFFPGRNTETPLRNTTLDSVFSRLWNKTRYVGCNNKPTIHDFRFTFVVNRMNLWAEEGMDLQVMMPYLSRYLGHKSINETFYYYYLVSDAYRTVFKKDSIASDVIPEVQAYE
jgi:site-specific recombinase XerD